MWNFQFYDEKECKAQEIYKICEVSDYVFYVFHGLYRNYNRKYERLFNLLIDFILRNYEYKYQIDKETKIKIDFVEMTEIWAMFTLQFTRSSQVASFVKNSIWNCTILEILVISSRRLSLDWTYIF